MPAAGRATSDHARRLGRYPKPHAPDSRRWESGPPGGG
jgi:hypothetical protein